MAGLIDVDSWLEGLGLSSYREAFRANDVDYDAYLANDRTLADPEVVRVEKNGKLRLRIINGSSGTNYFIDLGELKGDLIATDGIPVQPINGSRFPLAVAQRVADVGNVRDQVERCRRGYGNRDQVSGAGSLTVFRNCEVHQPAVRRTATHSMRLRVFLALAGCHQQFQRPAGIAGAGHVPDVERRAVPTGIVLVEVLLVGQ